jgi:hypothetical protein
MGRISLMGREGEEEEQWRGTRVRLRKEECDRETEGREDVQRSEIEKEGKTKEKWDRKRRESGGELKELD